MLWQNAAVPELPEVETTRRGLEPHLVGRRIETLILRRKDLRWPIPGHLPRTVLGQPILAVRRRAKYLLIDTAPGSLLLHLGMSGRLRLVSPETPAGRHDHYDLALEPPQVLRFTDPRRFGCLLWQPAGQTHPRLRDLGPEPLDAGFKGAILFAASRGRTAPAKALLLDQTAVAGLGNIYVAEALFAAGIRPTRPARRLTRADCDALADAIRRILRRAVARGGTTLRDFLRPDGAPGYFEQELLVYGRAGEPCRVCGAPVRELVQSGRSSCYCPRCQA